MARINSDCVLGRDMTTVIFLVMNTVECCLKFSRLLYGSFVLCIAVSHLCVWVGGLLCLFLPHLFVALYLDLFSFLHMPSS